MAPGMGHCGGGEGPSDFDKMEPIEKWVEEGQAPDQLLATKFGPDGGGEGPSVFDKMALIEAWVEEGRAPDRVLATKFGPEGEVEMRRPLCAYPARAVYDGNGDPRREDSFSCATR
jgi:feruloyl esterase